MNAKALQGCAAVGFLGILGGVALIIALGSGGKPPASTTNITFSPIGKSQIESVLIPSGTPADVVNRAVRAHCGARQWCKVLGWVDRDRLPRAMPLTEVAAIVNETCDFKFNCNLVVIDFLIRHGYLNADNETDYSALATGLHAVFPKI